MELSKCLLQVHFLCVTVVMIKFTRFTDTQLTMPV